MATTIIPGKRVASDDPRLLVKAGQTIWEQLPLLLLIDIVIMFAVFPAAAMWLGGLPYLALVAAVIACGPVLAGAFAMADRMNRDDVVTARTFARLVRRHALHGVAVMAVPGAVAMAFVALLDGLSRYPDATWLMVPLLLDCSVAMIVAMASIAVLSLATTGNLRGWQLWRASLAVGVAQPLATFGALALLVVLAFLVQQVGFVLLAVIPAPCAVVFSAMSWATVERYTARSDVG